MEAAGSVGVVERLDSFVGEGVSSLVGQDQRVAAPSFMRIASADR